MRTSILDKPKIGFKNNYINVFILCFITAFLFFIPFIIMDKGYFLYYGDFNVQQIPFYKLAHEAVQNGDLGWNWNTDLGVNFIGSYSFYLLGSPFFWITLIFPNWLVPFLIAPLLMLKYACAGVASFAFIKRFTRSDRTAIIGAMLYAFSGFNAFNIFFNHFHDVVVVFPLLLVALEECVLNNRRGWFAVTVWLAAMINYFFFVGEVVFILIYFILRCLDPEFKITLKRLGALAFEAVIGVLLACALLIPSALAIMDNPRTSSFYYGMNMLFYGNEQRYGLILQSLFFPPDVPARPNFFPDSNAKWSSVSAFLPLFSMCGVITFVKTYQKHWAKRLLILSLIMACVPILNSAFYAFNSSYYARWFYMPTLIMAMATCVVLEDSKADLKAGLRFTFLATIGFTLIGIIPTKTDNIVKWFGIPPYPERFWIYVAIAILSLLLVYLLIILPRRSVRFTRLTTIACVFVVVVYSVSVIAMGRDNAPADVHELMIEDGLNAAGTFTLDEDEFYRVDEDKALDNTPMLWKMPTIQAFHSIVPPSVMEFYESMGVDRSVASRPEVAYYGVRALTSVKYLFFRVSEDEEPYLPGFTLDSTQNDYDIYKNDYFIPMGFTYDYSISRKQYDEYTEFSRDKLILSAMCLSEEDQNKYADILPPLANENFPSITESEYFSVCEQRQQSAGYSFEHSSDGFVSKINLEKPNLVFYSVPYEKGWSATVNGKEANIVRSNIGFMAVEAPVGDNEIVFTYRTPGLTAGTIISLIALLLLALYLLSILYLRKKYPTRFFFTRFSPRNDLVFDSTIKTKQAYLTQTIKTATPAVLKNELQKMKKNGLPETEKENKTIKVHTDEVNKENPPQ